MGLTWSLHLDPLFTVTPGKLEATVALEALDAGEAGAAIPGVGLGWVRLG